MIAEDKVKFEDMVQTPPAGASRVDIEIIQNKQVKMLESAQVLAEGLSPVHRLEGFVTARGSPLKRSSQCSIRQVTVTGSSPKHIRTVQVAFADQEDSLRIG